MDSIAERLIKLEEEAKKIVIQARENKLGTHDYLEKQKADIEAAFFAEADNKIKANYESEMKKQEIEINEVKTQVSIKKAQITKYYNENKSEWIREIYDNIIGR